MTKYASRLYSFLVITRTTFLEISLVQHYLDSYYAIDIFSYDTMYWNISYLQLMKRISFTVKQKVTCKWEKKIQNKEKNENMKETVALHTISS